MKKLEVSEDRRTFLKQMGICFIGMTALNSYPNSLLASKTLYNELARSSPEAQGISSVDILKFIEVAEKSDAGLHSFMIIRHGFVVSEGWWAPYRPDLKNWLYSLSKSVTSTAIGISIQEGRLNLDDKVISFFPDKLPEVVDSNLAAMNIHDLLTMSCGHEADTLWPMMSAGLKGVNWVKTFLSTPVKYRPGTHFVYDTGATYMLSAILQKVTGQRMVDYLQTRLFLPLGIKGAVWQSSPDGINIGGAGLRLKTEDIAKFGQLYLQKGKWNGVQILSKKWVEEATSFQIRNDETGSPTKKEEDDIKQGFGYLFWLSRPVAQGAYRAEGAFCQYSIVMPEQDAVVAITAEGYSTHRVMNLVWDRLLPSMKNAALPNNPLALKALKEKQSSLKLVAPTNKLTSPLSASISDKNFKIDKNSMNVETISFSFFGSSTCVFTLRDDKKKYDISCGLGEWEIGETNIPGSPPHVLFGAPLLQTVWKIAASGMWKDDNTFVMTWRFFDTPHYDIITCKFENNNLQLEFGNSITRIVGYKDPRPVLTGHLIS